MTINPAPTATQMMVSNVVLMPTVVEASTTMTCQLLMEAETVLLRVIVGDCVRVCVAVSEGPGEDVCDGEGLQTVFRAVSEIPPKAVKFCQRP
jgi:hypothetical protein